MTAHTYLAIDLKSFYASVECVARELDPLTTNLVVADPGRTEKTICLAVSPSLKSYGIPGRARLFEVVQKVREVNSLRRNSAPKHTFTGESFDALELQKSPQLAVGYLIAPPRMAHYIECSARIYQIYLQYVAPEDIHVYSIDEVFIDVTRYLRLYRTTARELALAMIRDVLRTTGITATAGIGTNLYLAKIAMDIEAKKMPPDADGVRIAQLDEIGYRRKLWDHRPLTDFWRVGRGYAKKLEAAGMFTMGDVARMSNSQAGEDLLYKMFGVNAELLIDHAWGWEPCAMAEIRAYRPESRESVTGQVFQSPYPFEKARLAAREMADALALDLVDQGLATDRLVLTVGYDRESLTNPETAQGYRGEVTVDGYGRKIPKHAHGTAKLPKPTASTAQILEAVTDLFDRIVDKNLLVRRLSLAADRLTREAEALDSEQLDLFSDGAQEKAAQARERRRQEAVLAIRKKYGKNAILKGMSYREGATAKERNEQIGGHKA